jgi:hypothetical protein
MPTQKKKGEKEYINITSNIVTRIMEDFSPYEFSNTTGNWHTLELIPSEEKNQKKKKQTLIQHETQTLNVLVSNCSYLKEWVPSSRI